MLKRRLTADERLESHLQIRMQKGHMRELTNYAKIMGIKPGILARNLLLGWLEQKRPKTEEVSHGS